jgi:hypothetical protein
LIQFSKQVQEAMWGDAALLKELELFHKDYLDGNKIALWDAVLLCGHHQLVMPDWLRDGNSEITRQLAAGELRDFNEAFGVKFESKATRKKKHRQAQNGQAVLGLLQKYRLEGASMNAADILDTVACELGISRRDVEDINKENRKLITSLPRGNPDGGRYAFAIINISAPKRFGRPTVRDSDG